MNTHLETVRYYDKSGDYPETLENKHGTYTKSPDLDPDGAAVHDISEPTEAYTQDHAIDTRRRGESRVRTEIEIILQERYRKDAIKRLKDRGELPDDYA